MLSRRAQCLRDFNQLPLRETQPVERCLRLQVEPQLRQQSRRRFSQRAPVDEAWPACRHVAQKNILGHRQLRHEVELLVDHADAERQRIARALDIHSAAVDSNLADVFAVSAAEDLHQRRLTGPVLAEQHVHFAGVQRQIDAVERDDAGKRLPNASHLEDAAHRTGISYGGPPGSSTASPSQRMMRGPGAKRSLSENIVLRRVKRDGVFAGLSLRGNACTRTAVTSRALAVPGSGIAARKQPSRTIRYSVTPRSDDSHLLSTFTLTAIALLPASPQPSTNT